MPSRVRALGTTRDLAEGTHDLVVAGSTHRGHGWRDRRPGAGFAEAEPLGLPLAFPLGLCDGDGDDEPLGSLLSDGHSSPSQGSSLGSSVGVGSSEGSSLGSSVGSSLLVGDGFLVGDGGAVVGS